MWAMSSGNAPWWSSIWASTFGQSLGGMELGVFLGLGDTNMNGAEMMKSLVWSGQCSKWD